MGILQMKKHLRKRLKEQVKDERSIRLEEAAKMRVVRDEQIEKIQKQLKEISKAIYTYNKLGKVARIKENILGVIADIADSVNN